MSNPNPAAQQRLVSLDQFRGYTVIGMILVNYVGGFAVVPEVLKHHNDYCSYADTIMPQFLFAVGFAFRLTFERRVQREGLGAAYGRMVRRLLGLALVAIVVYGTSAPAETWTQLVELGPFSALAASLKRHWFQTLMHIAATSLWILPVIRSSFAMRICYAALSAVLHVLLSWQFNFVWCNSPPNAIDGGPLGFLTWSIPAIVGTLACDMVVSQGSRTPWIKLIVASIVLMVAGWGLSCGTRFYDVPPERVEELKELLLAENPVLPAGEQLQFRGLAEAPFVQPPPKTDRKWNYWMMSQRAGTLSYLTFCAGFSLIVYMLFHFVCDKRHWEIGLFRVFGTNALIAYILHSMIIDATQPFVPRDSPGWYVTISWFVIMAIMWTFVRYLERSKVYLRL
jgi:predicted acyltransferase